MYCLNYFAFKRSIGRHILAGIDECHMQVFLTLLGKFPDSIAVTPPCFTHQPAYPVAVRGLSKTAFGNGKHHLNRHISLLVMPTVNHPHRRHSKRISISEKLHHC